MFQDLICNYDETLSNFIRKSIKLLSKSLDISTFIQFMCDLGHMFLEYIFSCSEMQLKEHK